MGTFTLPDPYEGWTREQLRQHCRKLSMALNKWQLIAANMTTQIPGGVEALPDYCRDDVKRICDAYSD